MDLQITIKQIPLFINVAVRILTAFIFSLFLIPLIFKEATVKNGLRPLRFQLLFTGLLIFFINTIGLVIIIFRFAGWDIQSLADVVTLLNTVGFLIYALIGIRIYTQNYSAESKARHARYELQEKKHQKKKRQVK